MTVEDLLQSMYIACQDNGNALLAGALAIPLVGTLLAWIGRGGKTDADGKIVASVLVGLGIVAVVVELVAIALGVGVLGRSLLEADPRLLAAPLILLIGCVLGVRLVFPLNELGSVRTARDLGLLVGTCAAILWFFSKFEGWHIVIFGHFTELIVVLIITAVFVTRVFRRVFPPA